MFRLLIIAVAFGSWYCGGNSPPPTERKKPEHPDDEPPDGDGSANPPEVEQARAKMGSSFTLLAHAIKRGVEGCGTLRVQDLRFLSTDEVKKVAFSGEGRWASFPQNFSTGGGQIPLAIAHRSGDFPISSFTSDYPRDGDLGLKYLVTGTYDLELHRLHLMIRNMNARTGEPSTRFLMPVYKSWTDSTGETVSCLADDSFEKEFMVAVSSEEIAIDIVPSEGEANVCGPCESPVDQINLRWVRD